MIKFTRKGQGKMTYKLVKVKRGKKSYKKYFKINKTTGKIKIKKNRKMKKGTYKVKILPAGPSPDPLKIWSIWGGELLDFTLYLHIYQFLLTWISYTSYNRC